MRQGKDELKSTKLHEWEKMRKRKVWGWKSNDREIGICVQFKLTLILIGLGIYMGFLFSFPFFRVHGFPIFFFPSFLFFLFCFASIKTVDTLLYTNRPLPIHLEHNFGHSVFIKFLSFARSFIHHSYFAWNDEGVDSRQYAISNNITNGQIVW